MLDHLTHSFWPDKGRSTARTAALIIFGFLFTPVASYLLVTEGITLSAVLPLFFAPLLGLIILQHPFVGVISVVSGLLVLEVVPEVPFATSLFPVVGGITLIAYFIQLRWGVNTKVRHFPRRQHVFGLLFIIWIFVSNARASLYAGRNWLLTFFQLWVLLWLTAQLLITARRQKSLFWVFAGVAVISALFAVQEAFIGEGISRTLRGDGIIGGESAAARYFVVAILFLVYLRSTISNMLLKMLILLGTLALLFGVIATVSRSGWILLLFVLIILLIEGRVQKNWDRLALLLSIGAALFLLVPADFYHILQTIPEAILAGTDTVGTRYNLWRSALRMWIEHPVTGVGTGNFSRLLPTYGADLLAVNKLDSGTHNMYLAVLVEAGAVGFILFLGMILSALQALWRTSRESGGEDGRLARLWFFVLLALLIGGITKHDQYDKLLWMVLGISTAFPLTAKRDAEEFNSVRGSVDEVAAVERNV